LESASVAKGFLLKVGDWDAGGGVKSIEELKQPADSKLDTHNIQSLK
jgi:hypothetical protein